MSNLPSRPFDGMVFIDAFRIRWIFDASTRCWRRDGMVSDIPLASDNINGLLSAQLKSTLDGIPQRGGHFGIIARPLPTLTSEKKVLFRDTVKIAFTTDAGSTVRGNIPFDVDRYKAGEFRNNLLIFTSGTLINEVFLIFDNNNSDIFLHGDAGAAKNGDKFDIVELDSFNPSGVLSGDIELVSETLDITCVDTNGEPVDLVDGRQCFTCETDDSDEEKLPGLDIKVNNRFVSEFCAIIPGCEGPRGDKGEKGDPGAPGTGDGPQGEQGDPGEDAPEEPAEFTGVKINDIVDIFDTAIVNVELDAENNRLNVIKAKVRAPDRNSVAEQFITTPIDRTIRFTDDRFGYELLRPTGDAIEDPDVTLLHYPEGSAPNLGQGGVPTNQVTQVGKIKLSEIINRIIDRYNERLDEISEEYNLELKRIIEEKDEAARTILANLAKEVAECEWSTPMQFCLGLEPNCFNPNENLGTFPFPVAELLGGSLFKNATATDLGFVQIRPGESLPIGAPNRVPTASLPTDSAYLIQYLDGAIRTNNGYTVGDTTGNGTKLRAVIESDSGSQTVDFPIPSDDFTTTSKESVIEAYKSALITEMSIFAQFTIECPISDGTITLESVVGDDIEASGVINLRILQIDRQRIEGTQIGTVRSGPDDELSVQYLTIAVECNSFSIEVSGDSTAFSSGESVTSATLTTESGNTITGSVSSNNSSSGFSQVVGFGILPIGSFGSGIITINVSGGSNSITDAIPVTIGTEQ